MFSVAVLTTRVQRDSIGPRNAVASPTPGMVVGRSRRILPTTFRGRLLGIAAGALLVRVLYIALLVAGNRGFDDRLFFHETANNLASGRGYIDPFLFDFFGKLEPSAGHPPGWPFFLSIPTFIGLGSWSAQQYVCAVVGAVAVVLVGLLGRRVAGPRVGLIAAGLAAVHPSLIARDGSLMSETLYGVWVLLALLAAYRVLDRGRARDAALLGVLIALAALTRGEALLYIPLLALPVCLRARPRGTTRGRLMGAALAACVLTLAPWTIRNFAAFGEPVLISLNDASVLAGANCSKTYSGPGMGAWDITCLADRNPTLSETDQSSIWRRQGLRYIRKHSDRLPAVIGVRVLRTWDLYEPSRQARADGRDYTVAVIGTWLFLLAILPLAVVGAVILDRHRRTLLIVLAPAVVATVAGALTWGLTRLRHPADLSLLVLAAIALAAADARRRSGGRSSATSPATRRLHRT